MRSWKEECVYLLKILGGEGSLDEICAVYFKQGKRPFVKNYKDCICKTLQTHTRGYKNFNGEELFVMVDENSEMWALSGKFPNAPKQTPSTEKKYMAHAPFKQEAKIILKQFLDNYENLSKIDKSKIHKEIVEAFKGEVQVLMEELNER